LKEFLKKCDFGKNGYKALPARHSRFGDGGRGKDLACPGRKISG
jgi:hypothetical protein